MLRAVLDENVERLRENVEKFRECVGVGGMAEPFKFRADQSHLWWADGVSKFDVEKVFEG